MASSKEVLCGLGSWRPAFLQPLASKKVYMLIYGILGIIQGMFFTYLSAALSTLERQFGIKSEETAYLMSGNEISQILFLFVMPFIVKVKKRPFWTAVGLLCSSIGCFMMAMPHWTKASAPIIPVSTGNATPLAIPGKFGSLCSINQGLSEVCDEEGNRKVDWSGLIIMFIGILLTGIGNCAFYSFGVAYLDDNTSKENSPIMLSITYTVRLLGPTLGFLLGTVCLRTYVNIGENVTIEEGDPNWIGAWWLGFPIIGILIFIFAGPLVLFPERLPKLNTDAHKRKALEEEMVSMVNGKLNKDDATTEETIDKLISDKAQFIEAFKRLLTNKVFMYNFGSSLFFVFAFMGFGTFMPKYMEYNYRMKVSTSSAFSGGVGTVSKAIGLLVSGWAISKWKPSARFLSGWNVVIGALFFVTLIIFSTLGCPSSSLPIREISPCNQDCGCSINSKISPICAKDGVTNYYSPCLAGCKNVTFDKATRTRYYSDCSCIKDQWTERNMSLSKQWVLKGPLKDWEYPSDDVISKAMEFSQTEPNDEAIGGWCEVDCKNVFTTFSIVMFILMVLGSTGRIGNVLVALRCIDVRDKSLSMAFNVVFLSLLAMLPAPIVYGKIIDKTCILFQMECGQTTNCMLYDLDALRNTLMLTTAFIMSIGVLFDVAVWYYCKDVYLFDQVETKPQQDQTEEEEEKNAQQTNNGQFHSSTNEDK